MFEIPDILDVPEIYFESPELPSFPELTLLYGLIPRGLGTGACESLKSHVGRLADAHRVSPTTLLEEVLSKKLVAHNISWKHENTWDWNGNSHVYSSMGDMTRGLTIVLTEVTGVEGLFHCTMLSMRDILDARGLVASESRHCPLCLQETRDTVNIYGQLIWELECVTACPVHRIQLVPSKCGVSQGRPLILSRRKLLSGVCSTCGSIGYLCRGRTLTIASDVEI
ncbi:hypothetical protein NBG4_760005 [Candidatus Sulfobium mesophilum]|uniref:TniQ domain-containing protein n=1 Tax=Candidatus Sulfobium mesophilum TaxID=2016548 RepID=A0A2U3QKE0_9BACT|nr:hypothetical protein NBG4_760005 [Candidatus Sulfobium mesophilum]